jgi:hypothetical protein
VTSGIGPYRFFQCLIINPPGGLINIFIFPVGKREGWQVPSLRGRRRRVVSFFPMGKKKEGGKSLPYGEEEGRVVGLFPTGKKREE